MKAPRTCEAPRGATKEEDVLVLPKRTPTDRHEFGMNRFGKHPNGIGSADRKDTGGAEDRGIVRARLLVFRRDMEKMKRFLPWPLPRRKS